MNEKLVLHEDPRSGNCYKVALTAALVDLPIEHRRYDILRGETRTRDFLDHINANGRIPVLQVGNRFLPESNAACFFLADGSNLVPEDRLDRADMLRWLFWEQYSHEPNVATLRFWLHFLGESLSEVQRSQIPARRTAGEAALKLMDEHLQAHAYFVGESLTLADIALYAYTHVAEEGGFRLDDYPNVQAWLERVASTPRFIRM